MIYLLTAIGLSPGGSSTVHIYTQTIHRTTQNNNTQNNTTIWESAGRVVEKVKTHFFYTNFFPENRTFYEITWENIVQPDRPQMTI